MRCLHIHSWANCTHSWIILLGVSWNCSNRPCFGCLVTTSSGCSKCRHRCGVPGFFSHLSVCNGFMTHTHTIPEKRHQTLSASTCYDQWCQQFTTKSLALRSKKINCMNHGPCQHITSPPNMWFPPGRLIEISWGQGAWHIENKELARSQPAPHGWDH